MSIATTCPHCGKKYKLDDSSGGRKAKCKVCQQVFVVPRPHGRPDEVTGGGVPVYRPSRRDHETEEAPAVTPYMTQIERHLTRTIGPIGRVFHELVSDEVHIDLLIIPPTGKQPSEAHPLGTNHYTIVTCGLSAKPQNVPPQARDDVSPYQELMVALPADWPGLKPDGSWDDRAMDREENWWPMKWLKTVARMPHEYNTFLAEAVTVPNGENADPFAPNTRLGCMMVFHPISALAAGKLQINDAIEIQFWSLWPLYPEEMQMKLDGKFADLMQKFQVAEMTDLIQPDRPNHGRKKGWFGRG